MKDKLKNLFSNTWIKIICIISIFLIGIFLLGKCNKVKADNFVLSDGTISSVTYNEGQLLKGTQTVSGVSSDKFMYISKSGDFYQVISTSSYVSYAFNNGCTYANNVLTCARNFTISSNTSSITPQTGSMFVSKFTISADGVFEDGMFDVNYSIVEEITPSDVTNARQEGYNSGYSAGYTAGETAGLQANQDTIYQNGYNTGYTAGKSDGYDLGNRQGLIDGYQNGYSAGESAGLTTGYNNGYSAGESAGYNTGYSAGQNSVDITIDNQEYANNYIQNNNYHSDHDYMNYGSIKYDEGYTAGYEIAEDEAAFIVINPYEEGTEKYDKWGEGISDAYYCYFENGAVLNECYDDSKSDFAAYEEGFSKFVSILQNEKDKLDNIIDLTNRIVLVSYVEGQNSGYESGKKIGYNQALKDEEAFLGFIPATLGGVVANFMPILTYEVYGISIMNLIGLIAMIGIAIIIVKFIVG